MEKSDFLFLLWNLRTLNLSSKKQRVNTDRCLKCQIQIQKNQSSKTAKMVLDNWFSYYSPISFLFKTLISGAMSHRLSSSKKMTTISCSSTTWIQRWPWASFLSSSLTNWSRDSIQPRSHSFKISFYNHTLQVDQVLWGYKLSFKKMLYSQSFACWVRSRKTTR